MNDLFFQGLVDHMKIGSPVGLNLLVDGTVPKVWNLFCYLFKGVSAIARASEICKLWKLEISKKNIGKFFFVV